MGAANCSPMDPGKNMNAYPSECPMHQEQKQSYPSECPMHQEETKSYPSECPMHKESQNDIDPLNMVIKTIGTGLIWRDSILFFVCRDTD